MQIVISRVTAGTSMYICIRVDLFDRYSVSGVEDT